MRLKGGRRAVKTSLNLDEATWKALRVRAIEEGTSATRIIERLVREYLKTKTREGGR